MESGPQVQLLRTERASQGASELGTQLVDATTGGSWSSPSLCISGQLFSSTQFHVGSPAPHPHCSQHKRGKQPWKRDFFPFEPKSSPSSFPWKTCALSTWLLPWKREVWPKGDTECPCHRHRLEGSKQGGDHSGQAQTASATLGTWPG